MNSERRRIAQGVIRSAKRCKCPFSVGASDILTEVLVHSNGKLVCHVAKWCASMLCIRAENAVRSYIDKVRIEVARHGGRRAQELVEAHAQNILLPRYEDQLGAGSSDHNPFAPYMHLIEEDDRIPSEARIIYQIASGVYELAVCVETDLRGGVRPPGGVVHLQWMILACISFDAVVRTAVTVECKESVVTPFLLELGREVRACLFNAPEGAQSAVFPTLDMPRFQEYSRREYAKYCVRHIIRSGEIPHPGAVAKYGGSISRLVEYMTLSYLFLLEQSPTPRAPPKLRPPSTENEQRNRETTAE